MAGGRVEITDVESSAEWCHVSLKLRKMRRLEVGLGGLAVVVLACVAGATLSGVAASIAAGAGALVIAWVAWGFVNRRYESWGYLERADDLLIRRGVLIKRLSIVPYGRMQFVDVTAGLAERLFGIATVRLHTAAAATDARLPGLETSEAARLREQLTRLGEARAAGI
ncbi:MAG: PH domain-containing protein [Acidimicrobiales bacterium]|jgi:hypothetical protein